MHDTSDSKFQIAKSRVRWIEYVALGPIPKYNLISIFEFDSCRVTTTDRPVKVFVLCVQSQG
jgi:hypothetical protein